MIKAIGSVAGFAGPYAFGYLHTRTGSFSRRAGSDGESALGGGLPDPVHSQGARERCRNQRLSGPELIVA